MKNIFLNCQLFIKINKMLDKRHNKTLKYVIFERIRKPKISFVYRFFFFVQTKLNWTHICSLLERTTVFYLSYGWQIENLLQIFFWIKLKYIIYWNKEGYICKKLVRSRWKGGRIFWSTTFSRDFDHLESANITVKTRLLQYSV